MVFWGDIVLMNANRTETLKNWRSKYGLGTRLLHCFKQLFTLLLQGLQNEGNNTFRTSCLRVDSVFLLLEKAVWKSSTKISVTVHCLYHSQHKSYILFIWNLWKWPQQVCLNNRQFLLSRGNAAPSMNNMGTLRLIVAMAQRFSYAQLCAQDGFKQSVMKM